VKSKERGDESLVSVEEECRESGLKQVKSGKESESEGKLLKMIEFGKVDLPDRNCIQQE
jgi:hypothetical protein